MNTAPGVTAPVPLCSYCESSIHKKELGHIEHHHAQKFRPDLRFVWTNLFLSCESSDHCGHFKDSPRAPGYSPDELIAPDVDDPNDFLQFYSNGEVRPRPGISEQDALRAQTTIAVLNLNHQTIRTARRNAVASFLGSTGIGSGENSLINLDDLQTLSQEDREAYFQDELEASRGAPYETAVAHFITRLV